MNELVEKLRNYAEWAEANIYEVPIMLPDDLRAAADAITAAVEDLTSIAKKFNRPCHWCEKEFDDGSTFCLTCDDEEHNGNFEWRGLQLGSKTSDKEVE